MKARMGKSSRGRDRRALVVSIGFCCAVLLVFAATSPAATVTDRPLLFEFNGADTTAGPFEGARAVAIDRATGNVYVSDEAKDVVDKFNANGQATPFASTGTSSLDGSKTPQETLDLGSKNDIAVDNSSVNPGRIYVASANGILDQNGELTGGRVNAFSPGGEFLWQLPPKSIHPCGVAVDTEGHLWVGDSDERKIREFASSGSPPAEIASFETAGIPCRLDLDGSGDVYVSVKDESGLSTIEKYVSGVFASTLDPTEGSTDVTVDQSSISGHIFSLHNDSFNEYDSAGSLLATFGENGISDGKGIGYNATLDRVYVAQSASAIGSSGVVSTFGPVATGTVPDVTIEPPEVRLSEATFHGTVNPQSVPNNYYFEWKKGTSSSWVTSVTSPPQALPEDSTTHAVSFNATGLAGNTTYQVRLVGVNTTNGLRSWSTATNFKTKKALSAPAVSIDEPSSVTTTSAEIAGTVDPQEDFGTTWWLETSQDANCETFSKGLVHELGSTSSSPVPVSEALTKLLPSQHYCVRLAARNSFSNSPTVSEAKEFETGAVAPFEVSTAFASPRSDTSARLNGRINPEGERFTYWFEYSEDGGATWIPLPSQEDVSEARDQIVVGEELEGLLPGTSYQYRFVAENAAGPASPQGDARTFVTRTTEEMERPARGIELVNSPEKGNQHVHFEEFKSGDGSFITEDGNKLIWFLAGGAPGGTAGTSNSFLATRTVDGWSSRSLIPPASDQVGNGKLKYQPEFATADFKKFIFRTEGTSLFFGENAASDYVRLDDEQHQQVLAHFDANLISTQVDVTSDTSHVLHAREDTKTVEDIGVEPPEEVGLMQDGSPPACGIVYGAEFAGSQNSAYGYPGYHWIASTDASRVYFQTRGDDCGGPSGLYQRNRETDTTTLIAANAAFIRATVDGHGAFFTTTEALAGDDSNATRDIYEWSEEDGAKCLTCLVPEAAVSGVQGNVRISDDFSHIYFQTTRQLLPGFGKAGDLNLYVLTNGELRFIAVQPGDNPNEPTFLAKLSEMQMSADGNVMVFLSSQQLTADRMAPSCANHFNPAHPCVELYRYDDRDGSLECISCLHDGVTAYDASTGNSDGGLAFRISRDGDTIAFATVQKLVPNDINGSSDIYEWRNGARGLITDGQTEFPDAGLTAPTVVGVDADGSSIFFLIAQPGLTGYENDGVDNVYDARIGGGFPRPTPASHCIEDSCQPPQQAAPGFDRPASSAFVGRGNAVPKRRCRHGKVRRRGHCVSRHRHKHRRHERHGGAGRKGAR